MSEDVEADRNSSKPIVASTTKTMWLISLGVIVCTYFFGLAHIPALSYTEGLYAEIAREMLHGGSWILPHLDGAAYVEKPPLLYWLEAGVFALFGAHIWAARLVSAGAAILTCTALWQTLKRADMPDIGIWAGLVLAATPGWVIMAHTATFDTPLASLVAMSLLSFYLAAENGGRGWRVLAWLGAALAFMDKGPVGPALIGIILATWAVWEKKPARLLQFLDLRGILVFLSIVLGWSFAAASQTPGFWHEFYWTEQFGRYLGTRVPHDYFTHPYWFYLPWVLAAAMPWGLTALLIQIHRQRTFAEKERRLFRLGCSWIFGVTIFFSFADDKSAYYLLPALPGMALVFAVPIAHWVKRQSDKSSTLPYLPALLSAAAVLASLGLTGAGTPVNMLGIALTALAVVTLVILAHKHKQQRPLSHAVSMTIIGFGFLAFLPHIAKMHARPQINAIRETIIHSAHPNRPLVVYQKYDPFALIPFKLRRKVWIYQPQSSELYYAEKWHPDNFPFLSSRRFDKLLRHHQAWLITRTRDASRLYRSLPAPCVLSTRKLRTDLLLVIARRCHLRGRNH